MSSIPQTKKFYYNGKAIFKGKSQYSLPNLKEWQLGYIAGIIDGEGWIGFSIEEKGKRIRPNIVVTNTEGELIKWLIKVTKTNESYISIERTKRKPIFRWRTRKPEAILKILSKILPYLKIKKEKARYMISQLKK